MKVNLSRGVRRALFVLALAPVLASSVPAQQRDPLAGLDAYIRQAMGEWPVAGLAIAIVKDDSVVFARGYGVREAGKPEPVDTHTLFAIGSNTKLFTAVAAGMMADAGKLAWDDRVIDRLPWFRLYDPWVTREIRVRDLLSHRSGLGRRGDMIWYASGFDRDEVIRRVRYLEPNTSFRSAFGYQNIMVSTAGEVVAAVAGESWDEIIRERIFVPLGMGSSNTSVRDLTGAPDVATPHTVKAGRPVPIPWRDIDNIAPAGSINSSVDDMARWLRLLLSDGVFAGDTLVRAATLREIESPQTIVPFAPDTLFPSRHFSAYGLGIGMSDYRGVKVLAHTGGIDGMLSQVGLIPERRLGIVVLTNTDGPNNLFAALLWRVFDAYLGAPPRDWSRILLDRVRAQEAMADSARAKMEAARVKDAPPSLSLAAYAGTYENPMYPPMVVVLEGDHLSVHFGPELSVPLEPWQYETFRARPDEGGQLAEAMVTFALDERGRPATLSLDLQGRTEFTRKESETSEGTSRR
jgi:CubicO group peptidase (beta-lactamase class C family)